MKLLNLGCGSKYHKDWVNVDFVSNDKGVLAYDLLQGIPYKDNTFDVVYHSHIIEHFPKENVNDFIKECYRVLKPDGIIRIATPNLEEIVRNYFKYLDRSLKNDKTAEFKYDWTMIEMYDQCIRTFNGGELGQLYIKGGFLDPDFVYQRTGFKKILKRNSINRSYPKTYSYLRNRLKQIAQIFKDVSTNISLKNSLLKLILRNEFKYYELGKFRLSGEVHQWMYDRFSLKRLLIQNKFKDVKICQATKSRILNWNSYTLDTNPDGTAYKPDSIFIEAVK